MWIMATCLTPKINTKMLNTSNNNELVSKKGQQLCFLPFIFVEGETECNCKIENRYNNKLH